MKHWTFRMVTYLTYDDVTAIMPHDKRMSVYVDGTGMREHTGLLPEWMRPIT